MTSSPLTRSRPQQTYWATRHSDPPLRRTVSTSWRRFTRYATRWLSFLGRLQPPTIPPSPYAEQLNKFADYLRLERGLSPRTIEIRCHSLREFLARLAKAGLRLDTLAGGI